MLRHFSFAQNIPAVIERNDFVVLSALSCKLKFNMLEYLDGYERCPIHNKMHYDEA